MNQILLRLATLTTKKAIFVGVALTGIWYYMVFNDGSELTAKLAKVRGELQLEKAKEKESERALAEIASVRASIDALSDQFKLVSEQLPTEIQMSDVLKTVDKVSSQSGLKLKTKEPRPSYKQDSMEVYPLMVSAEGSYAELTSFFYYLSSVERISRIRSFRMVAPGEYRKDQKLSISAEISSYKYVPATSGKGVGK